MWTHNHRLVKYMYMSMRRCDARLYAVPNPYYCVDLYVFLCQSVTLFLFMYMQFFIVSLHWKYTICILVNIIRETNPISLCYK